MSVGRRRDNRGHWHEFGEADLEQIAASFFGAPFVPGHPADDQPELGKATKAEFKDGRLLITDYEGVDATFKALVNSGELPGISVKLRLPGHPENPGDVPIIRHIGFLGRSLPADEGIAAAAFSAPEDLEVEFSALSTEETMPTTKSKTPVSAGVSPDSEADDIGSGRATQEAEFAQRQADLEAREAEFAREQATFRRTQAITPVLNGYVADGKLLPGEVEGFTALFASLDDEHEIQFSQGDDATKVSASAFLKDFLKGLPKRGPELGEVAPAIDAEFNSPADESPADKTRKALATKYARARAS